MQRRFILKLAATLGAASLFAATAAHAEDTIKVGVTGGPHAQIMEVVKTVAAKNGLNIKIVEFSDYVQPNAALAGGDLDANSYQHDPYLAGAGEGPRLQADPYRRYGHVSRWASIRRK